MKRIALLSTLLLLFVNWVQAQEMVRIVRWKSPVTGDFESMPEGRHTDAQLQSWGYSLKTPQYLAYRHYPTYAGSNATAVYRWTMPNCAGSIIFGEHEIPDRQLREWGYKDKEFQFYALGTKPTTGDFIAVNRWINAKLQGDPCRDFTLTVAETEYSDQQLIGYGYTNKLTQFWVPRSTNLRVTYPEPIPSAIYDNQNSVPANSASVLNEMVDYLPFALTHCESSFDSFDVSALGYSRPIAWAGSSKEWALREYIGGEKRVIQFVLIQRRNDGAAEQLVTYRIYEKAGQVYMTYGPANGPVTLVRKIGLIKRANSYVLSWRANNGAVDIVFTKAKGYYIC